MSFQSHKIKIDKTAHFYTQGNPDSRINFFWIVAHGYGQLGSRIIRKFNVLDESHFILAPEGLSRFYWKNDNRTVAASWMTSKDRLDEIDDYINYLHVLYEQYCELLPKDVVIIPFGFSQGVVTIWRWLFEKKPHFHHFVSWAGWFASDLDYLSIARYLKDKKLHYVVGDKDQFYTKERLKVFEEIVISNKLKFNYMHFEGTHEIPRNVLLQISNRITS